MTRFVSFASFLYFSLNRDHKLEPSIICKTNDLLLQDDAIQAIQYTYILILVSEYAVCSNFQNIHILICKQITHA